MQTIQTLNNGAMYIMEFDEAEAIVSAYAAIHCGSNMESARREMHLRQLLDELPTIQRVAIRRYKREHPELFEFVA